jgi:outer membrane protein assembly factor BamB
VWKFKLPGPVSSSPIISDGIAYFGGGDSLYAVDVQSGQEKWKFKTGGVVLLPPAIAAGVVYVGSDDAYLYAVDAQTGQEKWSRLLDGDAYPGVRSPAIRDGWYMSADSTVRPGQRDWAKWKWHAQTGVRLALCLHSSEWSISVHG